MESNRSPKLFMLLLGCKPPGRHTEQHDIFMGIGTDLKDLVPQIKAFWPEPERIHIDAWKEIRFVDGYQIQIRLKTESMPTPEGEIKRKKLFFINLGGYQENKFEEQHYIVLSVHQDRMEAIRNSKESEFFKKNRIPGSGESHIDDKYGIDIDDLYEIEEILTPFDKEKYVLEILPSPLTQEDEFQLGYLKLSDLEA